MLQVSEQLFCAMSDAQVSIILDIACCRYVDGVRQILPHSGTIQSLAIIFRNDGFPRVVSHETPNLACNDCWAEYFDHGLNRVSLGHIGYTNIEVVGKNFSCFPSISIRAIL